MPEASPFYVLLKRVTLTNAGRHNGEHLVGRCPCCGVDAIIDTREPVMAQCQFEDGDGPCQHQFLAVPPGLGDDPFLPPGLPAPTSTRQQRNGWQFALDMIDDLRHGFDISRYARFQPLRPKDRSYFRALWAQRQPRP